MCLHNGFHEVVKRGPVPVGVMLSIVQPPLSVTDEPLLVRYDCAHHGLFPPSVRPHVLKQVEEHAAIGVVLPVGAVIECASSPPITEVLVLQMRVFDGEGENILQARPKLHTTVSCGFDRRSDTRGWVDSEEGHD